MTTFTIHEAGGFWYALVAHGTSRPIALPRAVGILEASRAVQYRWPMARLTGIR